MDMSPWKGWSAYGRAGRTDGEASPHRERSGGAAGADASPNPGPIPAPGYGSPVAWQGWSARLPEPAAVEPTSWAGWSSGREIAAAPEQPTLKDKQLVSLQRSAPLAAAAAPKVVTPVGDASFYEAAPMAGQGDALGKRAAARDSAPPPQQASRSLADAVARAREERKFTRGDYTTALKLAKASGEKVGSLELDDERLAEAVDKFALALTNKDYQMALRMSTEAFYGMDADSKLKAMCNKITIERLNKLGVDRLRCAYVAVRAWLEKKNLLGECADGVPEYLLLEYLAGVKEEGQKSRAGGCDALEQSVFAGDEPMALLGPAPRVGTLPQTGHTCGEYHRRGIQDLCKLFRFNWDGSTLKQNFRIQGKSDRVPQAAQPPTIRMVVMLERFAEDKDNSIVLRHLAAGYLLSCFGSLRIGNAQHCWIPHLLTDVEILAGFVCQDKTPKRGKARPRPFWAPCRGATGSNAWLDV